MNPRGMEVLFLLIGGLVVLFFVLSGMRDIGGGLVVLSFLLFVMWIFTPR